MMKTFLLRFALVLFGLAAFGGRASAVAPGNIELAIKNSFNFRVVLRSHVDVRMSSGVATLTGRAEDESTKLLAAETALAHPGVDRVVNRIEVQPWLREFSDGWIARHIELRLLVKAGVNPETTQIIVREGVARLRGTALTEEQKAITGHFAGEIQGVKAVVNELEISDAAVARRRWDGPIDDASITSQLRHIIRQSPEVRAEAVEVSTVDGTVMITGTAHSSAEKDRLTQLAREVRGVVSVSDQLALPGKSAPIAVRPDV